MIGQLGGADQQAWLSAIWLFFSLSSVWADSNFFDISKFNLLYSVSDSRVCVSIMLNAVSENNPILLVIWKALTGIVFLV